MLVGGLVRDLFLTSLFSLVSEALVIQEDPRMRKMKRSRPGEFEFLRRVAPRVNGADLRASSEHNGHEAHIDTACTGFSRNVSRLAFYHLSKCGGTNLLQVLREGGLTKLGNSRFIGEFENSCQRGQLWQSPGVYRDVNCAPGQDTYVISSIRNPFSFYVSYWQMLIVETQRAGFDIEKYGCVGPEMKKRGLLDAVHKSSENNRTSFARFLNFFINDLPKTANWEDCALNMASIYKRLLLTNEGSPRYDDMMVMEDSWPSILRVLRRAECLIPGTFDLDYLEKRARERPKGECNNKKKDLFPYHCFYDEKSRGLVSDNDKIVLQRHGYSFETFSKASSGSCHNVVD